MTSEHLPSDSRDTIDSPRRRSRYALPLPIDDIVRRYIDGESEQSIAQSFDVSRNVIARRLEKAGVERRSYGGAQRLRYDQASPEDRMRLVEAAHAAKRGRPNSFDALCRAAATRERKQTHISANERIVQHWLSERGVPSILQKAIGPYNADLAVGSIAVECFGGGWHATGHHSTRSPERFRYILDQGWNVVVIWIDRRYFPLTEAAADYVVSFHEQASGDPPMRGQYRVIRGDGKELPTNGRDLDELTIVPTDKAGAC